MNTKIMIGDCLDQLKKLPDESVHCCVTSPPYWGLRKYKGEPGIIGLEPTFEEHLSNLVEVFREVRRVLRKDGTCWLNYGDAYVKQQGLNPDGTGRLPKVPTMTSAHPTKRTNADEPAGWTTRSQPGMRPTRGNAQAWKPKDLMMMPSRVALALQADGWWIRSEIVWHKPNPMPESCTDRPTSAHEKLYLLSKSARYFYDGDAVRVPHVSDPNHYGSPKPTEMKMPAGVRGRLDKGGPRHYNPVGANLRNVWKIATHSFSEAHFATFPPKLVEPCIKAGTSQRGVCKQCGGPWERDTGEKVSTEGRGSGNKELHHQGDRGLPDGHSNSHRGCSIPWKPTMTLTTGWSPTCQCTPQTSVPATVLDPFAGAGTVGLVAQRLGRDSILIEISEEYAEMSQQRIEKDNPNKERK